MAAGYQEITLRFQWSISAQISWVQNLFSVALIYNGRPGTWRTIQGLGIRGLILRV
jgi:hypothetical protein